MDPERPFSEIGQQHYVNYSCVIDLDGGGGRAGKRKRKKSVCLYRPVNDSDFLIAVLWILLK